MHVRSSSLQRFVATVYPWNVAQALAVLMLVAAPGSELAAQMPFGNAASASSYAGPPMPYVDAQGNTFATPTGYEQPCDGGSYAGCNGDGYPGPNAMGCGGTYPPIGYDLANDAALDGFAVDQRGPHYFDVRAEYVNLTRDESFRQHVDFTSFNIGGSDIRLSSDQLDVGNGSGFRIFGRYDICPLAVVEFGYMGIFDWQSGASFTDPLPVNANTGNLFSLFSQFGTNPATVAIPGGPMPETERSITQSISLDVKLQSAEISYRRYWVGFIPRVSGTILAGFRYTRLEEEFNFHAVGEAALNYFEDANNNLAGFQTGGDIWVSLLQGLRIGAEGKVGLFNNHYTLSNVITTTPVGTTPPSLMESFHQNQPALISEASADIVADVLPSLSLRAGYEVLFMNSLVLAGENFNTASPYGLPGQVPRVPFVFDQGNAFMHGFHAGIEYIW